MISLDKIIIVNIYPNHFKDRVAFWQSRVRDFLNVLGFKILRLCDCMIYTESKSKTAAFFVIIFLNKESYTTEGIKLKEAI